MAPRNPLKAIEVYREGHRRYPDNPDICQEFGLALADLRSKSALTYLEKGAALSGFAAKPLVDYLDYLWRFGAFARAIKVFKSNKSLDNSCKALKIMLKTYYASGRHDEAEDCAAKILRSAKQPLLEFWIPFTEAALYFLDRGEFAKCLAVRETGFPGQEKSLHDYMLPVLVVKGLALIRQRRYPEAEELFARLCREHDEPGAWSWIMLARMRELNGNASAAVETLITAAKEREKYCDHLLYQAGLIVQRNKITDPALLPFRMISLKMQQHYCKVMEKERIITAENSEESSLAGLDYLHNGMVTGTSPLPWFNPQVFAVLNMPVWYAGADPLVSFVNFPGHDFSLRYHALQVCKAGRSPRLEFGDILDGLNGLLARPEEALAHAMPVAGEGERALGPQ